MGCDIHLRLEIKSKKIEKFRWEACHIFGYGNSVWSYRNYSMFVVDTKAEYEWEVSEEDAERWVKQGLSHYYEIGGWKYCSDPDTHSENWCTTQEMEDCVNRVFINNDGTFECGYIEWLALLGAMKGYEQSGDYECRAVFWFDN